MKVSHIYHSGILAETEACYYLFDYYKGVLPSLDTRKPVLVFASHSHPDHYAPVVFQMLEDMNMEHVIAVLPNEIKAKKYPTGFRLFPETMTSTEENTDANAPSPMPSRSIVKVYHDREYDLPCRTHIKTLLSTDAGVAFLLTCPEGVFYHAGDLNDWITDDMPEHAQKQMTGSYRASLRGLKGISIDVACLPLDPRLGTHYADGFLYFLEHYNAKKVCPIHYGDRLEIVSRFLEEHPKYRDTILT